MSREKIKIRAGEFERHETFKYKGGLFQVVILHSEHITAKVLKPRKFKKGSPCKATGLGQYSTFPHSTMVQRYNEKPKKETIQ